MLRCSMSLKPGLVRVSSLNSAIVHSGRWDRNAEEASFLGTLDREDGIPFNDHKCGSTFIVLDDFVGLVSLSSGLAVI